MHSSPIDLLVRAPGQRKAEPSEPETDGRFSDLLRAEPDPATEPTEAASGAESPEAVTPETAETGAQPDPITTATADEAAKVAAIPTDAKAVIQPVAAVPEAITHVAPAAATGSAEAGTATTNGGAAPAMAAAPAVPTPNPAGPGDVQQAAKPVAPTNPAQPVAMPPQGGQPSPVTPVDVAAAPSPEGGAITSTIPTPDPAVAAATRMAAPVAEDAAKPANPTAITEARNSPAAQAAATVTPAGAAPAVGAGVPTDATNTATPDAIARPAPVAAGAVPSPEVAGDSEPTDDAELLVLSVGKDRTAKPTGQTALATAQGAGLTNKTGDPSALSQIRAAAPADAQSVDPLPPSGHPDPAGVTGAGQAARPAAEAATIIAQTQSSAPPPPAADQVVLQLRRAVANGVDRLTVQLKPATLGRVDVQMEVGFDGRVQAVISAERPETLQLLQRDARTLTTALMDAGLQADSGSLSFNLRGQTGDQAGGGDQRLPDGGSPTHDAANDDHPDATTNITLSLGSGRVDIKV